MNRPFPHYAPVSKHKEMRTRLGWTVSYKSLYFVHPSLELVPLFTGMRERSIVLKCSTNARGMGTLGVDWAIMPSPSTCFSVDDGILDWWRLAKQTKVNVQLSSKKLFFSHHVHPFYCCHYVRWKEPRVHSEQLHKGHGDDDDPDRSYSKTHKLDIGQLSLMHFQAQFFRQQISE